MKLPLYILKAILLTTFVSAAAQAQWTQSALPLSNQVTDIFTYGNVWYVATSNNGILQSQNFTDWTSSSAGMGTTDIRRIISSVEGANIVLYASTANGIYRSTMLGYNWTAVNNGLTSLNVGALFSDGTILLASTADGVFRSENYGQSWSVVSVGASNQTVRCFLKNGTDMLAGLANTGSYLYRSTDNGLTWSPYGTGLYEVSLLAKLGDELFASSATLMYHSTDNGLNWSPASSGLVPGMYIMDMTTQGDYLYVATLAGGYVQHTDSSSFRLITSGMPMGGYMSNTVAVNNEYVVFGTVSDGLWYAGPGVITSTNRLENSAVSLYPNPAENTCMISVAGWQGKACVVRLTDMAGRTKMEVMNVGLPTEGISFDVSLLPRGVFFVSISNGQSVLVRKLVKK
ncbi:MAG: T9SS type A sorting domain-containing protein [Lentimicrobium sp.]